MIKPKKLNLISKSDIKNIPAGNLPNGIIYNVNTQKSPFYSYGLITKVDNYLSYKNTSSKLYIRNTMPNLKDNNFEFEIKFSFDTLKVDNILFSYGGTYLNLIVKNTYKNGLSINVANTYFINVNYRFKINTDYVIAITKEDSIFVIYINGISYGYLESVPTNNAIVNGNFDAYIGNKVGSFDVDPNAFNGKLYYFNISFGPTLLHYNSYTKYGDNKLSSLNFHNKSFANEGNNFYCELETVQDSKVTWTYPSLSITDGVLKNNGSAITTNYGNNFTLYTKIFSKRNNTDINIINYYNTYKLSVNLIITNLLPEPEVIVNANTKSALDFENGIIDKIGTTVWNKEGSANIQGVNKIFGSNSFETKALGDSLYTNSNIITGGSTPFTIEFYALIKDRYGFSNAYIGYPLLYKNNDGSGVDNGFGLEQTKGNKVRFIRLSPTNTFEVESYGNHNIQLNEIYKYTITYDGSALRWFINDKPDSVTGILNGFKTSNSRPFTFFERYASDNIRIGTKGLIDNINIHDGIATKVRDPDPYEEFLVVDLAFDGENNSTKIIDNGTLKSAWIVNGNAKLSTVQKFDGFSSLYLDGSGDYIYNDKYFNLGIEDYTISLSFISLSNESKVRSIIRTVTSPNNSHTFYLGIEADNTLKFLLYDYDISQAIINKSSATIIDINKEYKVDVVCRDNITSMYINNKLEFSEIALNIRQNVIPLTPIYIGYSLGGSDNRYFSGYIKNFKIYKGVAVIPESPAGKIQLDFDNNVIDKYNNSTWTNNGVTFDQVNSVKGHSAYFNGSSTKLFSNSTNFNFGTDNFLLSFDFKNLNRTTSKKTLFNTTNSSRIDINNSIFQLYNNNLELLEANIPYSPDFYKHDIYRTNDTILLKVNDVYLATLNTTSPYNLASGGFFVLGTNYTNNQYINGYIDNFKSYKEDLVNLNTTTYKGSGVNFLMNSNNDELTITAETGSTTTYKQLTYVLNDSPIINNFILESSVFISKIGTGCSAEFSSNTSDYSYNSSQCFGYSFGIFGKYIYLNVGSNSSTANMIGVTKDISTYRDDNFHSFKAIIKSTGIDLFIDDNLILTSNENRYNAISSIIGMNYTNYIDVGDISVRKSNTKYVKISDLNGNELYYKDWKSKIDNVIDKPAVHLPLETNAINTGFTPLTINSVGNPTYTTVDGKKCIKFESGKYLTINSNNIFNLGNSSDFYIEFDFYIPNIHPDNQGHILIGNNRLWNAPNNIRLEILGATISGGIPTPSAGKLILQYYDENGTKMVVPFSSNSVNFGQWNKLEFTRENNIVKLILNDIVNEMSLYKKIDFSLSNTDIGRGNINNPNSMDGYMSNFKMFVGTSVIPETYNDKKVLDLDFNPTRKSYLFKDNNNKCVIHPVNITQRDYQNSQYCCTFNGTDQFLQLGKNDLFNFGNDDFIINIKFKGENGYLLKDNGSNITGISISNKLLSFANNGSYPFNNQPINYIDGNIQNITIVRKGSVLTLYSNKVEIKTSSVGTEINFNFSDNTFIGTSFNGTIYSIKVLRNASDLSLVDEPISQTSNKEYTLTNGIESQSIVIDPLVEDDIKFVSSNTNIVATINGNNLVVPKVDTGLNPPEIQLFNGYNGDISKLDMYDIVMTDDDIFIDNNDELQLEYGEVEIVSNDYEFILADPGKFIVQGFIEGVQDLSWSLYNKENDTIIIRGTGDYYYDGLDPLYIDEYEIIDNNSGKHYPINNKNMIRGAVEVIVPVVGCASADFVIKLYRRSDSVLIGIYEIKDELCSIKNLDCNTRYDVMLFDLNTKVESRMMSNRTPIPY